MNIYTHTYIYSFNENMMLNIHDFSMATQF